jgi:hypothetical protein
MKASLFAFLFGVGLVNLAPALGQEAIKKPELTPAQKDKIKQRDQLWQEFQKLSATEKHVEAIVMMFHTTFLR